MGLKDWLEHSWNALTAQDKRPYISEVLNSPSSGYRPDRIRPSYGVDRTIINAIYTRISIDAAAVSLKHVRVDENEQYVETIKSGLDNCLEVEANIDQTGRAFIQDLVYSLCDEGVVAVIPTETDVDPESGAFQILQMRVGKIIQWFPEHIQVEIYNDKTGQKSQYYFAKRACCIIENPLYMVMNAPNSTARRLGRKLALLDKMNEDSGSGKLDIIIQLPYIIKTPQRKAQAELRRKDIEMQLAGSKYGIAYTDGTERITQLNRPAENNLLAQIEYDRNELFSQLGMVEDIFKGTADESVMLNYHNRTIEPILSAITDEMRRKFISKTGRTQGQTIRFFRDPFRLVPVEQLSEIADKMTRNEIMSPNEIRAIIGYKPSKDSKSDELRNRNIQDPDAGSEDNTPKEETPAESNSDEDRLNRALENVKL